MLVLSLKAPFQSLVIVMEPKKPTRGAFGRFVEENMQDLQKESKGQRGGFAKLAAMKFKALGDEERSDYEGKYQAAKIEYEEQMKAFLEAGGERKKGKEVKEVKKGKEEKEGKEGKGRSRASGRVQKDPQAPKQPAGGAEIDFFQILKLRICLIHIDSWFYSRRIKLTATCPVNSRASKPICPDQVRLAASWQRTARPFKRNAKASQWAQSQSLQGRSGRSLAQKRERSLKTRQNLVASLFFK